MSESTGYQRDPSEDAFLTESLSRDEDDDLRRLHWLSQNGALSALFQERLLERRLRDRRTEVRPPREFDAVGQADSDGGPA